MKQRAGLYIQQVGGYQAFKPAPLPPDPPVSIGGNMQALLSQADLALGRLDGAIRTLPGADLFVYMYVRKEAVLSSQIEGTQSSIQDLLAAEAHLTSPHQPDDVSEIVNYVAAMNHGLERLPDLPVSVRLIREIHEKLLSGGRGAALTPGEIRTSQNWIGSAGASLTQATFVPPAPQDLPDALSNLERFIHQQDDLPLLVRIGIAHSQFETIHPFLDGNGRVGRLLITFLLCERAILAKPVLYLSWYFKRNRAEYYERLQSVRDSGDWEGWLEYFLRGIAEASAEAARTAHAILELREQHRTLITDRFGGSAANGYRTLDRLFQQPIVSIEEIQRNCGVSYPTANSLVQRLAEAGILTEITGNMRHRRFRYDPFVALFDD